MIQSSIVATVYVMQCPTPELSHMIIITLAQISHLQQGMLLSFKCQMFFLSDIRNFPNKPINMMPTNDHITMQLKEIKTKC